MRVVAVFAIVESRTGVNVFNRLDSVIPYLELPGEPEIQDRGGRYRVFGSAQHPIALGAALAILIPLAAVIARRSRHRAWWLPAFVLLLGVLTTSSRTAVLMLAVEALVFLWLRPREVLRLWPALLPALVVIHFAVPGALGTTKQLFFPQGGVDALIAEQDKAEGTGRIAAARATLSEEFSPNPVFGIGFGTRITQATELTPIPNARVLDNEWVGMLAETRPRRSAGAVLDLCPLRASLCAAGEARSLTPWAALRRVRRVDRRLRGRDADLRRVLVHPGDVPDVRDPRARCSSLRGRRGGPSGRAPALG